MDGWQGLDRAALDAAYANADHIPGGAAYSDRWAAEAAAFRSVHPLRRIAYADRQGAVLDLFAPDAPRGVVCFVHGGYWRAFGPSDWSHLAAGSLARGLACAVIGYPLAPEARLSEITALCARAVDAAAAEVAGSVHLTGHSAGGQIVARLVMPDAAPTCRHRIATCVPISPVADLRPLLAQTLNDTLGLTEAEAAHESPALGQPMPGPRVTVHVGASERPSFLSQARSLATAWNASLHEAPDRHHFDVIDALADPASELMADLT